MIFVLEFIAKAIEEALGVDVYYGYPDFAKQGKDEILYVLSFEAFGENQKTVQKDFCGENVRTTRISIKIVSPVGKMVNEKYKSVYFQAEKVLELLPKVTRSEYEHSNDYVSIVEMSNTDIDDHGVDPSNRFIAEVRGDVTWQKFLEIS